MKCLKCGQGELKPILKDGKSYAQCDKCGALFTAHDLRNHTLQPQKPQPAPTRAEKAEDEEYKDYSLGKTAAVTGWILCALFLMSALVCGDVIPFAAFLAAAVFVSPVLRNRVYLSGKIWIPLVIVLFFTGIMTYPKSDTEPKKIADKQETAASTKKQVKASAKKADKKDTEKENAEQEEQERIRQEQAKQERLAQEQAEQERLAQEQAAAAQAEQERIAQEQAAAQQAEQEKLAQEQAAQAEQQRIAQEQAAAAQAEQERIAQAQAAAQTAQTSNVWLSATGSKYHSIPNCGRMNPANARQVTLAEAQQMGIEACQNCH